MKYLLILFVVFAASCSKDKTANPASPSSIVNGTVKLAGSFTPTSGISVQGTAKIISDGNAFAVLMESFAVTAGPDLKVYLSKKDTPFEFINLGPLKANSGNQQYVVPPGVDFSIYKYVLIHCQQYDHLFAIAALNP